MREDYSLPGSGLLEREAHPDPLQQFDSLYLLQSNNKLMCATNLYCLDLSQATCLQPISCPVDFVNSACAAFVKCSIIQTLQAKLNVGHHAEIMSAAHSIMQHCICIPEVLQVQRGCSLRDSIKG